MQKKFIKTIRNEFPHPIAVAFSEFRRPQLREPSGERLDAIFKVGENISRFIGIVAFCECRALFERGDLQPTSGLTDATRGALTRPSWGCWHGLAREGLKCLKDVRKEMVAPELLGLLFEQIAPKPVASKTSDALDRLLTLRNDKSHNRVNLSNDVEVRSANEEATALLEGILEQLEFLTEYQLVVHNPITVTKPRRGEPRFFHTFIYVTGNSLSFDGEVEAMDGLMDSHTIVLTDEQFEKQLSLDPFYLFDTAGRAPDVYFFDGAKGKSRYRFIGFGPGGELASTDSLRADCIAEEIDSIETHIFGAPVNADE